MAVIRLVFLIPRAHSRSIDSDWPRPFCPRFIVMCQPMFYIIPNDISSSSSSSSATCWIEMNHSLARFCFIKKLPDELYLKATTTLLGTMTMAMAIGSGPPLLYQLLFTWRSSSIIVCVCAAAAARRSTKLMYSVTFLEPTNTPFSAQTERTERFNWRRSV